MFALTVKKFVLSNPGNYRAKTNPPKPRTCPTRPFWQWLGPNSSTDWGIPERSPGGWNPYSHTEPA